MSGTVAVSAAMTGEHCKHPAVASIDVFRRREFLACPSSYETGLYLLAQVPGFEGNLPKTREAFESVIESVYRTCPALDGTMATFI